MRRVELFALIREDARKGASIRALASRHEVHRRTVRQALSSSIPPERRSTERARPVLTDEVRGFIDRVLITDRDAPRKQRHTARRIFQRVGEELGATAAESTVRAYVGTRRRELGIGVGAYVPQHHPEGRSAEVDFYEAVVHFPGGPQKVQILTVRSEASGAELHRAYPSQTQAALFDAIARSLEHLGGVFEIMRFDNLSQAVARVLRGRRRVEQDRFVAFRSHYGFTASFTTPGIEGAHEKGGVEGGVGRFRRRWLTPVPKARSFEELNDYLRRCCEADLRRTIERHRESVGCAAAREKELLRPLPVEPFDVAELTQVRVDQKARITVRTNRYSVPVRLVGRTVGVRITPLSVEAVHRGAVVARHPRLHLKYGERLVLDHYLELLSERPGAFPGSLALHQERERGTFSPDYEALWRRMRERWGERDGTRHMIDVLLCRRSHPGAVVDEAVATALGLGVADAGAVALLCRRSAGPTSFCLGPIEVGELGRYDRPLPDTGSYDLLLEGVR